jgi:predicted phosphoadenosine phosphosulfate sulfurtransferase
MNLIKLEKIAKQYAIFCVLFKNSKQSAIFTNLLIDHANSYTKKVLNIDANPTFKLVTP